MYNTDIPRRTTCRCFIQYSRYPLVALGFNKYPCTGASNTSQQQAPCVYVNNNIYYIIITRYGNNFYGFTVHCVALNLNNIYVICNGMWLQDTFLFQTGGSSMTSAIFSSLRWISRVVLRGGINLDRDARDVDLHSFFSLSLSFSHIRILTLILTRTYVYRQRCIRVFECRPYNFEIRRATPDEHGIVISKISHATWFQIDWKLSIVYTLSCKERHLE